MANLFNIISPGGNELEFIHHIPEGVPFSGLTGANTIYVHGPWGKMVFQQLELDGFSIWDSQYFLDHPATLFGSMDMPVYELHSSLKSHFTYSWDGIGQPTEHEGQGGFSHTPFVHNKVAFDKGSYRTFDIHGTPSSLLPFANAYGKLNEVLDRAESKVAGVIDRVFHINGTLQSIIQQVRHPECNPGMQKRYYHIKAEEYLIHALQQMHADPKEKQFALTASLKEKAEHLESILRGSVEGPAAGASLPSLPELAKMVSTNMEYLRRAFRERYGTTVFAYHRQLRLDKAKVLLTEQPYLDLDSVAIECGFHDSPHLANAFKAAFHITPGDFRKQVRQ